VGRLIFTVWSSAVGFCPGEVLTEYSQTDRSPRKQCRINALDGVASTRWADMNHDEL